MKHLPDEGREQFWENTLDLIADWLESGAIDKMIPKKDEFLTKTYDVIQSQSSELKEKEKRIAQLEEALETLLIGTGIVRHL